MSANHVKEFPIVQKAAAPKAVKTTAPHSLSAIVQMAITKAHFSLLKYQKDLKRSIVSGFGWAIGVTLGFAFISALLLIILNLAGGIPLIGDWIANLVEATNASLLSRVPGR